MNCLKIFKSNYITMKNLNFDLKWKNLGVKSVSKK